MVRPIPRAPGISIVEAVVTLFLFCLVLPLAWTVMARHRTAGMNVAVRAEGLETIRTLAWLLPEELSLGRPGADWRLSGEDSLSLRAFRGLALVDTSTASGVSLKVCFRGLREPAPEKDSVLLLGMDGRWRSHDLVDRRPQSTPCAGDSAWEEERWTVSPAPAPAVLGRLFEYGSYHLAGGALRYRRGEGGRQPLTPERIERGRWFESSPAAGDFAWEVGLLGPPDPRRGNRTGSWRGRGW